MTAIDTAKALIFTGGTIPTSGASAADLSAEMDARRNADNQGDVLALQTDTETSTGQMLVTTIPAAQSHISLTAGQMLRFRCPYPNTGPDPIITLGGEEFVIKARNGSTLAAGDLPGGQRLLGYIYWNSPDRKEIRLSESVRIPDISGLATSLASSGKAFTSRTAAVNFGQANLPGSLSLITTIEGEYLAVRSFSNAADDPLFETQPSWGVALRLPRRELLDNEVSARSAMIRRVSDIPGYIMAPMDSDGNFVMPGASTEDQGDWPDWVYEGAQPKMLAPVLGPGGLMRKIQSPFIFSQHARDGTLLMPGQAQESDGGWAPWVYDEIWDHIQPLLPDPSGNLAEDDPPLWDGTSVYARARSDLTRVAVLGSSTPAGMASEIATIFADLVPAYGGPAVTAITNDAKSGERSVHTAARLGAIPALLTVDGGSIPASGPVLVTSSNMTGNNNPLLSYAGSLAGVAGTLAWSAADSSLQFTRTAAGDAAAVDADTPFIPDFGPTLRDRFFVISTGKNDLTTGGAGNLPAEVNARIAAIVDYLNARDRRFAIWTDFCNTGWSESAWQRQQVTDCNDEKLAIWGPMVFDQSAYILGSRIWDDAAAIPPDVIAAIAPGWTGPTQADLDEQAAGNKAPSLSSDAGHYNALGRYLVSREFRRWLIETRFYRQDT